LSCLAAAIHARADLILTFNMQDFPNDALSPFGIRAQHPDEFLCVLLEAASESVCAAAESIGTQAGSLRYEHDRNTLRL
jgi:hypothetical protein